MSAFSRFMFHQLQKRRHAHCLKLLDPKAKTLLDLGAGNGLFVEMARESGFDARGTGPENDVATTTMRADIITCFEVLEHLPDPVKAIKNLGNLFNQQLIISVPNEPLFSILRLGWEPEHFWAVTSDALKYHLGVPAFEEKIVLGRYYVGVWKK